MKNSKENTDNKTHDAVKHTQAKIHKNNHANKFKHKLKVKANSGKHLGWRNNVKHQ